MVNLHKKNESGIPTGRHRVTRIENAPSALQDEGALVVPPAFAAGSSLILGISDPPVRLRRKNLLMGFIHPCTDSLLQLSAGGDFTSVPASSHNRWLSERPRSYLVPGGPVNMIIAYP